MFFYLAKGGPVLILILIASTIGGAYALRHWFALRSSSPARLKSLDTFHSLLEAGLWRDALMLLNEIHHPFSDVWCSPLQVIHGGHDDYGDIEKMTAAEGSRFTGRLESALKPLGAIATILPMLGFLGTMLGLIVSFRTWEMLAEAVNISVLAGGIYQAMITTAAGLLTAIPLFLIYHFFVHHTHERLSQFSVQTTHFLRSVKIGLSLENEAQRDSLHVLEPTS